MVRGTTPESNRVIVLNYHEELKAWMEYARASVGKPTEARAAGAAGAARAVTNHRTKNPLPSLPSPLPRRIHSFFTSRPTMTVMLSLPPSSSASCSRSWHTCLAEVMLPSRSAMRSSDTCLVRPSLHSM